MLSAIVVLLAVFTGLLMYRKFDFAKGKPGNIVENTPEDVVQATSPEQGIAGNGINDVPEDIETDGWSIDSLKVGKVTAIDHLIQYNANIGTIENAEKELKAYGTEQREKYDNPAVKEIEKRIESESGIFAVNLGEMDEETALDVEKAVVYMFDRYPQLKGNLTNITLANLDSFSSGHLAITQFREYIINGEFTVTPYVVKHEILLGAAYFMRRDMLIKSCEEGVKQGHWPEGMNVSAVIAHELGHQVLNVYEMKHFGLNHPYYITEENKDAFSQYITDGLKVNQTVAKSVVDTAYSEWEKNHAGKSYEDFCLDISGYATGVQKDGGISYSETVAEALTDIYLNGSNASEASACIEAVLIEGL